MCPVDVPEQNGVNHHTNGVNGVTNGNQCTRHSSDVLEDLVNQFLQLTMATQPSDPNRTPTPTLRTHTNLSATS
jgi:hypothetical protein